MELNKVSLENFKSNEIKNPNVIIGGRKNTPEEQKEIDAALSKHYLLES